ALECAAAWTSGLTHRTGPTEIILSRQKVAEQPPAKIEDALRGGYVILAEANPEITILATGSEVGPAVEAARLLIQQGKRVRVVSMPCLEVFSRQDEAWRNSVLPSTGRRVSVEAGRTDPWRGWVGLDGLTIGVDRFGA